MILRIVAVFARVLKQILKDFRLMTMMFIGPIVVISLMYVVFAEKNEKIPLGIVLNSKQNIKMLSFLESNFTPIIFKNSEEAREALEKDELLVSLDFTINLKKVHILLEGTRPLQNQKIIYKLFSNFLENSKVIFQTELNRKIKRVQNKLPLQELKDMKQSLIDKDKDKIAFFAERLKEMDVDIKLPHISAKDIPTDPKLFFDIEYLFGGSELTYFDSIGPTLVGFLIFFIVFLIGGIAFLRERNTSTLSRTFATPIREWQFIVGYFLAFSVFILLQVVALQSFSIFVLNMVNNGSFFYLILINLMVCFTGLVLGFIFSTVSKSEFQLVQFVPMIIVPQFIFSGVFDTSFLPPAVNFIGELLPLHYASNALVDIAIRGRGFEYVLPSLLNLGIFLFVLLIINTALLRRIRQSEG